MSLRAPQIRLPLLLHALADPTRLRLLHLIAGREVCVCHLVEILRQRQPKISRHLAYLRRVGIVHARRQGKWMHYSLIPPADPALAAVLQSTLSAISTQREMQADIARLGTVCCPPLAVSVSDLSTPALRGHRAAHPLK